MYLQILLKMKIGKMKNNNQVDYWFIINYSYCKFQFLFFYYHQTEKQSKLYFNLILIGQNFENHT